MESKCPMTCVFLHIKANIILAVSRKPPINVRRLQANNQKCIRLSFLVMTHNCKRNVRAVLYKGLQ